MPPGGLKNAREWFLGGKGGSGVFLNKLEGGEGKWKRVAVGTPVTWRPPHGSVLEALPHTVLALGRTPKAKANWPPPDVPAPAHLAYSSGSASGTPRARAGSPWPAPFPPPPPQPQPCSAVSSVIWGCPVKGGRWFRCNFSLLLHC